MDEKLERLTQEGIVTARSLYQNSLTLIRNATERIAGEPDVSRRGQLAACARLGFLNAYGVSLDHPDLTKQDEPLETYLAFLKVALG